jgi:hypothetical protein
MWDAEVKALVLKGDLCLNVTRMSVAQGHCRSRCAVRQRHPASSARRAVVLLRESGRSWCLLSCFVFLCYVSSFLCVNKEALDEKLRV